MLDGNCHLLYALCIIHYALCGLCFFFFLHLFDVMIFILQMAYAAVKFLDGDDVEAAPVSWITEMKDVRYGSCFSQYMCVVVIVVLRDLLARSKPPEA